MHKSDLSTPQASMLATLSRRTLIRDLSIVVAGAAVAGPGPLLRSAFAATAGRTLSLRSAHTEESLTVTYWRDGAYLPEALRCIDVLLRDHRTDDVHPIEPRLLDLLHDVAATTRTSAPFEVISGYRSPQTNAMLRRQNPGKVSRNSFHMKGRAIDIRSPDVDTSRLRDAGLQLKGGGVGYYPGSDFVHLDTGRVRRW